MKLLVLLVLFRFGEERLPETDLFDLEDRVDLTLAETFYVSSGWALSADQVI